MATRATYQINGTTFYCHWDGYPTGAAQRFANMVAAWTVAEPDADRYFRGGVEDRGGGAAFAFIRGNLDAEPTDGHDAHGDTEYRYTLTASPSAAATIAVEKRYGDWDNASWSAIYTGCPARWLNDQRRALANQLARLEGWTRQEAEAEAEKAIPQIVVCTIGREYGGETVYYATRAEAEKIAGIERAAAQRYAADNPNKKIHQSVADAWDAALAKLQAAA